VSLVTSVPPALVFLTVAFVAATTGRRASHALGGIVSLTALGWILTVPSGTHLSLRAFGAPPFGFEVVLFAVDPVSRAVGLVFALVALANVTYAYGAGASARQTATALAYVGASLGAVFAGDWLTLVVWWELMAAAATVLLWRCGDAVRAGYRYAVYHQVGGAALVAGVLLQYARTGTFLFDGGFATGLPALLAIFGVGTNVGFVGLHVWVVDAYPRPDVTTTVVLSGFTTKVGVYTLVRVLPGESLPVAYLGGVMVLVGVTMAVLQTDVRRLLSYHIVSQVGYMVAGIGLGTAGGVAGGVGHLVNNVLYKTLLFMVAGAIILETGRESLKKLGGLGREMPYTAAAFAVAALAITGVPGFSGFVSKGFVTSATTAADVAPLWWVLQVGAVGTVVSFVKFGYYAFVRDAPENVARRTPGADETGRRRVRPATVVAYALLAVPCVVFGLAPDLFASLLPAGASTSSVFTATKLTEAAVITAAGVVVFGLVRRPLARVTAVPDLDRLYHPVGRAVHDGGSRLLSDVGASGQRTVARVLSSVTERLSDDRTFERRGLERASIGTGVLLLAVVAALGLVALLWPA
jgi:multicomponent Na+:H+ antiporter subunit D